MNIEILNQQKKKRLNINKIKKCINRILKIFGISSKKISFVFCDNEFIKKINKKYFKRNSATDVISFPLNDIYQKDYLGEVIISVEKASLEAKNYNHTFEEELLYYIIHGILHILGYKDYKSKEKEIMIKKQDEIFNKIKNFL